MSQFPTPLKVNHPYRKPLKYVKGQAFTPREIDVLACLTSGRSLKGISVFLDIHYKTLEVHMTNIRKKLGCTARDYIIDILENLPEHHFLNNHYKHLQQKKCFETLLHQAELLGRLKDQGIIVLYPPSLKYLATDMQKQFSLLSCQITLKARDETPDSMNYISIGALDKNNTFFGVTLAIQEEDQEPGGPFYYHLLSGLMPFLKFPNPPDLKLFLEGVSTGPSQSIKGPPNKPKSKGRLKIWLGAFLIIVVGFSFYIIIKDQNQKDLSAFLMRPQTQEAIRMGFKNPQVLQNSLVALVGPGGAGKTTEARNFLAAHPYKFQWELNGESKTTLINDFINLATDLAQKANRAPELNEILSIKDPSLQEHQLLKFIQDHLCSLSWVLLFDNIEDLPSIRDYLPLEKEKWGKGKILLTSRDQISSRYPQYAHIIKIPILTFEEKQALFLKLFPKGKKEDAQHTKTFLNQLPPFPLDISLAASYVNAIGISYEDYLKRLNQDSKGFNSLQSALHQKNDYKETRHHIIRQTFELIIEEDNALKDLSLLTCLLEAEDIPQKLFENHTTPVLSDHFIFKMKKYGLFQEGTKPTNHLFIHRSTQHHGLSYFLKTLPQPSLEQSLRGFVTTFETYYKTIANKEKSLSLNFLIHLEFFEEKLGSLTIDPFIKKHLLLRLNLVKASIYDITLSNIQKVKEILINVLIIDQTVTMLSPSQKRKIHTDLGRMHGLSGDFETAIKYYQESFNYAQSLNQKDFMIKNLISIGFEHVWLNKFNKAQHYLLKAITLIEKTPLPVDQKKTLTAQAYSFLGTLYSTAFLHDKDRCEKSLFYLIKAQENVQKMRQAERLLLRIYRNTAQTYARAGRYQESLEKGVYPARSLLKTLKGPSHTLLTLILDSCEGEALLRQGNIKKALFLLSNVVTKYQHLLGEEAAFMALYPYVNYIEALIRNKEYEKASRYIQKTLKMRNPAYTNFHSLLYLQLYYFQSLLALKNRNLAHLKESLHNFEQYSKTFRKNFKPLTQDLNNFSKFDISKATLPQLNSLFKTESPKLFKQLLGKNHPWLQNMRLLNIL